MSERASAIPALAEAFREHGYEGASVAALTEATGLGRGSLYNFFPGGKDEMARAVLEDVRAWFEENVFAPLVEGPEPDAVNRMLDAVLDYFRSGQRICLQGAFALGQERDQFAQAVQEYFERWVDALAGALCTPSVHADEARAIAVDTVARVQGAIVLARALDQPDLFVDVIARTRTSLTATRTERR